MLAVIFMVRLEAAARLQQEPSLSSSSFVPLQREQLLLTDLGKLEMRNSIACCLFSPFARRGAANRFHAFTSQRTTATFERRLPSRFKARIRHCQTG